MPDVKAIIEKSNTCLDERDDIPSAPLWHMGKVAILQTKESFELLQNTIDYLTCNQHRHHSLDLGYVE